MTTGSGSTTDDWGIDPSEEAAYDAYGDEGSAPRAAGGQRSKRRKSNGPRKPKKWVPVDEFGEPVALTDEQLVKLRERAQNLCLWHLGRGPRTHKELHDAMTKKGVPEAMADEVLARLAEFNYVNDEQFATNFVHSRHVNQRKGASVIRHELRRKGVDDAVAAEALEQITEESEREAATALVSRKLASTRSLDPNKRVQRLVGMLARKGYPPGLCYQVVREAIDADEADETGLNDIEMLD
jgi:regulatory protein